MTIPAARARKPALVTIAAGRHTRAGFLAIAFIAGLAATACIQQNNTYPIEILSEMHYNQSYRPQEPPRLAVSADLVPYQGAGEHTGVLDVPERKQRPYQPGNEADVRRARELFRVNCSVCHGVTGTGDGPAAVHLTSTNSYFATKNGSPYASPANLQNSIRREGFGPDQAFQVIHNGVLVMPKFGQLMSEEDIWDVVHYLYDQQSGIASLAR